MVTFVSPAAHDTRLDGGVAVVVGNGVCVHVVVLGVVALSGVVRRVISGVLCLWGDGGGGGSVVKTVWPCGGVVGGVCGGGMEALLHHLMTVLN